MLNSLKLILLGLILVLSVAYRRPAAAQERSTVVAEVGGQKVTTEELQSKEAGSLLQAQYKYYLAERDALDHLVNSKLLEVEAAREGLSVDELLKRHVVVETKEPTEDQIRFYYDGLETDQPFEAVREKIVSNVNQVRAKKARDAYLASLRSELGVLIELAPPSAPVDLIGVRRLGPQNAPVQLVEFADYECPYCQRVHADLQKLREDLGDKVALVYKDFPLPMHSHAEKAAEAARCAGAQGKFWEFHNALFETKRLQIDDLKEEARKLNLDGTRFDHCLDSGEQAEAVKKDLSEGQHLGLTGTPSFFANGHFLSGSVGYAKLKEIVELELSTSSASQQAAALAPSHDGAQK